MHNFVEFLCKHDCFDLYDDDGSSGKKKEIIEKLYESLKLVETADVSVLFSQPISPSTLELFQNKREKVTAKAADEVGTSGEVETEAAKEGTSEQGAKKMKVTQHRAPVRYHQEVNKK